MGGKCSGTSQNTSKVTHPNGEQVQAIWHMRSRANVPSQLLFFQQHKADRISACGRGGDWSETPSHGVVCPVHPGKVGICCRQTALCPTPPGAPAGLSLGRYSQIAWATPGQPAQESGWFCLLGRGTIHHLLMAMANQGLHTSSTSMWHYGHCLKHPPAANLHGPIFQSQDSLCSQNLTPRDSAKKLQGMVTELPQGCTESTDKSLLSSPKIHLLSSWKN